MADILAPDDVVPVFRSDLKLDEPLQGTGENQIVVTDPASGSSMTFHGFELSIARMLNGQRTAAAVVEAAHAVGLPISLETLTRFVKQLRSLGFLAGASDPPVQSPTTWNSRREWGKELRSRYQLALKEARTDHLSLAKQHLDELQRDQFDNTDVKELHAWVDDRLRDPKDLTSFPELFDAVERSWFEAGEQESAQNEQAAARPQQIVELPDESRRRPRRTLLWAAIAVAIVITCVGLIPWPTSATGTYELSPSNSVVVTVKNAGTVGSIATDGQWVEPGTTLLDYDTHVAKQKLAEAELQVAALQGTLDKIVHGLEAPNRALAAAQAELAAAQATLDNVKAARNRPATAKAGRAVSQANAKVKVAKAALAKSLAAVEATAGASELEIHAKLDAALAEREQQKPLVQRAPITAPMAGFVVGVTLKVGDELGVDAPLCRLEDTKALIVTMRVGDGSTLAPNKHASLAIGGKEVDVKIERVENGEARGLLDNPTGSFQATEKGELTIEGRKTSLLGRLF